MDKDAGSAGAAAVRGPRSDSPVFVLSTGRSGSTLVQRVLNCHSGLVVWGEHHGLVNGLADAFAGMADPHENFFPQQPVENIGPSLLLPTFNQAAVQIEWANPWSLAEYCDHVRSFLDAYFGSRLADGQRWGFKEIRYNRLVTLRFLRRLYPAGRFIFVTRDPEEVTRSKVFSFIKEPRWSEFTRDEQTERIRRILAEVRDHYRTFEQFTARHPRACLIIGLEDLVARPDAVIATLLDHVELDAKDFDWALCRKVLATVVARTRRDATLAEQIHAIAAETVAGRA
jgi:hypothetical protein